MMPTRPALCLFAFVALACNTNVSVYFTGSAGGSGGGSAGSGAGTGTGTGTSGTGAAPSACSPGDLPDVEVPPPLCATCDGCSLCEPSATQPDKDNCTHACDPCGCTCPAFECLGNAEGASCSVRCSEATTCAAACEWLNCDFKCLGCSEAVFTGDQSLGGMFVECTDAERCTVDCNVNACNLTMTSTLDAQIVTGPIADNVFVDCLDGSQCTLTTNHGVEVNVDDSVAIVDCGGASDSCVLDCTGSSSCDLTCKGDQFCSMTCGDAASCKLTCSQSAPCTLSCPSGAQPVACQGSVQVCDPSECN